MSDQDINSSASTSTSTSSQSHNTTAIKDSLKVDAEVASSVQKIINALDTRLTEVETKSSAIKERVERAEDDIVDTKNQNIHSLGLFVALFTFISLEFSLFKEIQVFSLAISLTLILAGLLVLFVTLLGIVIKTNSFLQTTILLFISLVLIVIGVFIPLMGIDKINVNPNPSPIPTVSPTLTPLPTLFQRSLPHPTG